VSDISSVGQKSSIFYTTTIRQCLSTASFYGKYVCRPLMKLKLDPAQQTVRCY